MKPLLPQKPNPIKPKPDVKAKPDAKPATDTDFFTADKIHRLLLSTGESQWKAMEPQGGAGFPGGRPNPGGPGGFPGQGGFPSDPVQPGNFRPDGNRGPGGFGEPFDNRGGQRNPGPGGFPGGPPGGRGGFGPGPGMGQMEFPMVEASATFDGKPLVVGLRFKGNSTFRMTAGTEKRPFKIDFNEYVDKQKFLGHAKLSVNPDAADPSHLRETLAYEIFRAMKVPAPRTSFAEVSIGTTGQSPRNIGLYTLVENVDDPLLHQWFGEHKGLLVKPEGAQGLRHLGDSWAPYERLYDPKGKPDSTQKRALIELTKIVHTENIDEFQRRIPELLEIDNFLRFLAVNVVTSNADSFLSMGHNFYLYRSDKTGKFHFLPWDLNHAFGGFPGGADPVRLSLRKPHSGSSPLIERLLATPSHRDRYVSHVRAAQALVRAASPRIAQLRAAVRPVVARESPAALAAFDAQFDPRASVSSRRFPGDQGGTERAGRPFGPGGMGRPGGPGMSAPPLVAFIAARLQSVDDQLAGKDNGAEPSDFGPGGRPGFGGGFPGGQGFPGGFPGRPGGFPER